ncbi:transketolase [Arthrobacter sp. SDTb3-6]|uniref:transketolase n=1 Tax=Arthrobacter sp. SDTb3-6 TaxID=2713571 RepID=UPI00159E0A13|nr:transketolase [Arthrobacter sp. SDTb3-6]NVM98503.1 transketolase [Arthrobacter sp. SDTb3-6]
MITRKSLIRDDEDLRRMATTIRKDIISMLAAAKSGHSAGPLGMAELLTVLYFHSMLHDPKNPDWEKRDVFYLSNGHTAPVLYAAMARSGYFPVEELKTLRQLGSRLQGHPERRALAGLESTSGPLGSGLSQAAGYAYVLQEIDQINQRWVYAIMGDGEINEGNVWEAAMFAGKYALGNLIAFIDRNNIQIDGSTEDVMPLGDLHAKWRAFDWHVLEIDGNNVRSIIDAIDLGKAVTTKPTMIIANTVPGKGVPFMEYNHRWHGMPPTSEQADTALLALEGVTAS